jgi:hypothetical protein
MTCDMRFDFRTPHLLVSTASAEVCGKKVALFVEIGYKNKVEVFIYLDLDGSLYFF